MKFSSIARPLSLVALLTASTAALADPVGEWRVADGTATVRIHRCGAALCGNIATTASAPGKDDRNPDPRKRNRSVLGMEILINMRPAGANLWSGTSYDAVDGQYYATQISLEGDSSLKIQGCAPGGGTCGTETWTRVR
ncbi:MAG TPA: DUF2147 domain-containing protein [Methylovirgula sp.]|nr:DUF2147 domain-containing protein [Methylovirgula sp.]